VQNIDALTQQMVAGYEAEVRALLSSIAPGEPQAGALLARCEAVGQAATARLFEAASEQAARCEARPVCPDCGRAMARHDRWRRPVISVSGEYRGWFQRFRCEQCRTGACPGEQRWLRFGCTPQVVDIALGIAARMPFEAAEAQLARFGIHLSDNTLQRIMRELGGEREAERRAEAGAVMRLECEVPAVSRPQRLYVEVDARSARVGGQWMMVYVAVFFETRAAPRADEGGKPRPERVSVVSHRDFAVFGELVQAEAQRRGIFEAEEVVLVGDGGNWVWPLLNDLVPLWRRSVQVLDWYHLTENLAKAVRAVWGEDFNDLVFKQLKNLAWQGQADALLDHLEQLATQAGSEAGSHEVTRVANYVRGHRERLNYRWRDLDGYQVGSGQVESRCKQLGLRIKGCGMDWSEAGLNAVLTVLADELTDPAVRRAA
jgi:hypothetical protein